jgi:hypothetical protein
MVADHWDLPSPVRTSGLWKKSHTLDTNAMPAEDSPARSERDAAGDSPGTRPQPRAVEEESQFRRELQGGIRDGPMEPGLFPSLFGQGPGQPRDMAMEAQLWVVIREVSLRR